PDQPPQWGAAEKPLDERCPPRRRRGSREQQLAGGAAELRLRHQPIDEPQTQRLLGAHGLARQHHLHCGADAERAYAPHGAAEARMDAELHLRESQRESVVRHAHTIAARERQLETAARSPSSSASTPLESTLAEVPGLSIVSQARLSASRASVQDPLAISFMALLPSGGRSPARLRRPRRRARRCRSGPRNRTPAG